MNVGKAIKSRTAIVALAVVAVSAVAVAVVAQSPKLSPMKVEIVPGPDPVPVRESGRAPARNEAPLDDIPVRVVQTHPVPISLPFAYQIALVIYVAGGLGAMGLIWKFVRLASRIVTELHEYGPVLREIAKEFKNDSGTTLKDVIDEIQVSVEAARKTAELAAEAGRTSTEVARIYAEARAQGHRDART